MYQRVWQEFLYEALTEKLESIKSKANITAEIPYWKDKNQETKAAAYLSYIGTLLNVVADNLKAKVTKELTVLIIPARFVPILYFGPLEKNEFNEIIGPYSLGVVSQSATVIVDPAIHNEFYAYNLDNPKNILKLEIKE